MDNSPPHDTENQTCPFGIHSISQEAKKNLNGVEKEIKGKSMLRFTQQSLDEFLGDASHV